LIWKKLRVVDGRLALMQDELALMQNGIKELQIMESRLFNVFMLNADAVRPPRLELYDQLKGTSDE
jgi:hypothetical protein